MPCRSSSKKNHSSRFGDPKHLQIGSMGMRRASMCLMLGTGRSITHGQTAVSILESGRMGSPMAEAFMCHNQVGFCALHLCQDAYSQANKSYKQVLQFGELQQQRGSNSQAARGMLETTSATLISTCFYCTPQHVSCHASDPEMVCTAKISVETGNGHRNIFGIDLVLSRRSQGTTLPCYSL